MFFIFDLALQRNNMPKSLFSREQIRYDKIVLRAISICDVNMDNVESETSNWYIFSSLL